MRVRALTSFVCPLKSEEARQFRRLAASYDRLAKGAPKFFGETAPGDDEGDEAAVPLP